MQLVLLPIAELHHPADCCVVSSMSVMKMHERHNCFGSVLAHEKRVRHSSNQDIERRTFYCPDRGFPPSQSIAPHVSSSCRAYMVQHIDKGSGEALTATSLLLYLVAVCHIPELLEGMREAEERRGDNRGGGGGAGHGISAPLDLFHGHSAVNHAKTLLVVLLL